MRKYNDNFDRFRRGEIFVRIDNEEDFLSFRDYVIGNCNIRNAEAWRVTEYCEFSGLFMMEGNYMYHLSDGGEYHQTHKMKILELSELIDLDYGVIVNDNDIMNLLGL